MRRLLLAALLAAGCGGGTDGKLTQAGYPTPRDLGVTFEDVDALRCIFPERG